MPLLSISVRGAELASDTLIKLERSYAFTELKLLHVYHNIDSINLVGADSFLGDDSTEQVLLFVKLGGLVENHAQIINYTGNYHTMRATNFPNVYSEDDYQLGQGSKQINSSFSQSSGNTTITSEADITTDNLIPIGASRHGTAELISRDVFKELHKGGVLDFNGELHFGIHYMNSRGKIVKMTSTTGGILETVTDASGKKQPHITSITLLFSYQE